MSAPVRVSVVGGAGMLGRAFEHLMVQKGVPVDCPGLDRLDLTSRASIDAWAQALDAGTAVINCAAWTDVDGAEANEAGADEVNASGVEHLAQACARQRVTLVHFSTDYVFDGAATKPYPVDHPRAPINAYGRSKARGEEALERAGCRHLLIRTSWLYAPWGKNFVRTIAGAARTRPTLRVVDDQRGRPTSAEHLARTSLALLERGASGPVHVTDGGECTWFGFATQIARWANPACRVEPCTTAEFPRPARRPAYSVLDLSRTEALLGPMPDWKHNLADVLERLEP